MNGQYGLSLNTLDDHPDLANAPYVVCVSDVQLLSDINFVYFLLQLPCGKLALLRFPLGHDI